MRRRDGRAARLGVLAAATAALVQASAVAAQAPPGSSVVIRGGTLPYAITLPVADAFAFRVPALAGMEAPGLVELLALPPPGFAGLYEVETDLWTRFAAPLGLQDVARTAAVDLASGVARLPHRDGVAWVMLDDARSGLLRRYAAMGERLAPEPSMIEVLRELRRTRQRVVIEVDGGFPIEPRRWDQRLLWAEFERMAPRQVDPVAAGWPLASPGMPARAFAEEALLAPGVESQRVEFVLRDGRRLAFVYVPSEQLLLELTPFAEQPGAELATLPGFDAPHELGTLLARISSTGGVPLAEDRLVDPAEIEPAPRPRRPVGAGAAGVPRPVRDLSAAAAGVVAALDGAAPRFALALLAGVGLFVLASAASLRRRGAR